MDCSDYPLTKCPDNGFCSECNDGSTTKYKLDRCDNCFSQISVNGGMCSRNYQYDKCPTDAGAAACSECTYSGKTVYNILTCKPGYTLNGVTSNSRTCVAKTCPSGYSTAYQSVADCGSTGSNGWTFTSSGYSGDKICGKCTAKTCASYGYMDKQLDDFLCKVSASVYKGNTQSTCYDCVSCRYAGIPLGTSYAYIGDAVCGTVCSNVKTSSKVLVGANLRTFSKDGRTGFCYAWQQSVDRAKKFCCCKNGSYTGDSVSGCK